MAIKYKDIMEDIQAYYSIYNQYLNDGSYQRSFGYGVSQWRFDQREGLERLQVPVLQKNEIAKHIKTAIAELASNMPSLEVKCFNADIDPKIVKEYQTLIYGIEDRSGDAKLKAYEDMLRTGLTPGIFLSIEYSNDDNFDQDVRLNYIDYESFYFDTSAEMATKEDGQYVGYLRRISKDEFKRRWPKSKASSLEVLSATTLASDNWVYDAANDELVIAHHFKKIFGKKRRIQLTTLNRVIEEGDDLQIDEEIIGSRMVQELTIRSYILSGEEILEEPEDYPVPFLPIVACKGYQALIKGKIYPYSYGKEVEDLQVLQNFTMSQVGASILYLRRNQRIWDKDSINQQTMSMLQNNTAPSDIIMNEKGAKPPMNIPPQEMSPTLMQLFEGTSAHIDSTLGRYESAQGATAGAQTSGIATSMEINQANLPIYYYLHPLITALNRVGKILTDLIPEVYGNERMVEGHRSQIKINSGDKMALNFNEEFNAEDYQIYIKAGASFTIQRDTYRKSMEMIYSRAPQELQLLLAPMMFELMDVPNLPRLEEIYKKFIALTQPQLYKLLQDVPIQEIEEEVKSSLEQKQQQETQQQQMAQSMQEMAMQKEQLTMQLDQMKVEIKQKELQLEQSKLQLQERAQEGGELENTGNYQIRTEELDQRQRDNSSREILEQLKIQADLIKAALAKCA